MRDKKHYAHEILCYRFVGTSYTTLTVAAMTSHHVRQQQNTDGLVTILRSHKPVLAMLILFLSHYLFCFFDGNPFATHTTTRLPSSLPPRWILFLIFIVTPCSYDDKSAAHTTQ